MNPDKYTQAAQIIIKEQQLIAGPLAIDLAKMVSTITFENGDTVSLEGNPKSVLEDLVKQYQKLFGNASVEASKQALSRSSLKFEPEELPAILK